ncbi:hypothetical protein KNO15_11160 [Leifsonia shinshuensis]|uniref:hypothetical protein n=1 Tax=Leifsonia shinshuensis TaxID=150026 RepID=UPI001F515489|nr:hypothetical protein [Leifsonia shinshuensis]MCI0157254.1 hypothetical protein [Leifsonia shinshuensis]
MNTPTPAPTNTAPEPATRHGVDRRTIMKSAAWAVPAIAVSAASPAAAVSTPTPPPGPGPAASVTVRSTRNSSWSWKTAVANIGNYLQGIVIDVRDAKGAPVPNATVNLVLTKNWSTNESPQGNMWFVQDPRMRSVDAGGPLYDDGKDILLVLNTDAVGQINLDGYLRIGRTSRTKGKTLHVTVAASDGKRPYVQQVIYGMSKATDSGVHIA